MILVAHYRRALLPAEERFRIPFSAIAGRIRQEFLPPGRAGVDRFLSVVLTLVIIVAIITTVYVIVAPKEGERFSEFYILGENQTATDYPDQIIAGQNYPMYIGVGNHEYRNMTYTIETWMLRTEFDNVTNTSHIMAMDPIDRLSLTLAHNETTIIPYNLSVKKTGYNRVEFLLFNESVPGLEVTGSDRINASYRDLHLWVTVEEAEYRRPIRLGQYREDAVTSRDEEVIEHLSSVTTLSLPSAINAPQRLHIGHGFMVQQSGDPCAITLQPSMDG